VTHFDSARTVQIVSDTLALARVRRAARQQSLPSAMAEEFAVMGCDVIRRHVIQAAARR
jgi:hypothetical protein